MRKAILNCPAVARRKFLRQVLRRLLKYSYIANRLFKKGSDSTNNFNRFSLVNRFSEVPMMGCEPRQFAPHVSRNKNALSNSPVATGLWPVRRTRPRFSETARSAVATARAQTA